eukprot:m.151821 g.151821  ORF g.151821 m.151821 type:complete len:268 (-) comp30782_c0_seq1:192-995(-)
MKMVGFVLFGLLLALTKGTVSVDTADDVVQVTQFVMAKCPMTTSLHVNFARTVMSNPALRRVVNFTQSFVGGPVGEGPVNETNWMYCYHGDSECVGHTTMLCAKEANRRMNLDLMKTKNIEIKSNVIDEYAWFDMVTCMNCGGPGFNITSCEGIEGVTYNNPKGIPENAQVCAESVGLEFELIDECVKGIEGRQLLKASHFHTMAAFAKHGGYTPAGHGYRPPLIPVIWIDGIQYNNPLEVDVNPYHDNEKKICDAYKGTMKPAICA